MVVLQIEHSGIFGGRSNVIDTGHESSFIIGTNLTSNLSATTFVNNISSQGTIFTGKFTTTKRNNDLGTTAENGMLIYNSTTNKFQGYANGAWVDLH